MLYESVGIRPDPLGGLSKWYAPALPSSPEPLRLAVDLGAPLGEAVGRSAQNNARA